MGCSLTFIALKRVLAIVIAVLPQQLLLIIVKITIKRVYFNHS